MRTKALGFFLLAICGLVACETPPPDEASQELTLYTHRHYEVDQEIFDQFTEETGIEINVVNASADELILRMENEGEQSPADVLITVDAGRLERAHEKDLLQSVTSDVLATNVPEHLRESENHWFGITKRARVMVYDKEKGMPEGLETYEDLAGDNWEGNVLIRSSGNIYNQSLLASLIAHHGEEEARVWAEAVVERMARAPKGNDRDQMKALIAGEGDVAVVNTYYVGHLMNSEDQTEVEVGHRIGIFFPNQATRGTHVNISGAGVAKHAPNRENAIRFIEYLTSVPVQSVFASANYEYPVNPAAQPSELLASWGSFNEDQLSLATLGELNKQAVLTFDEAGWE